MTMMIVCKSCCVLVVLYFVQCYNTKASYNASNAVVSAYSTTFMWNPRYRRGYYVSDQKKQRRRNQNVDCRIISSSKTHLCMSGIGIATNYTWKEDAYEIELSVRVPKMTRTKDIRYKATSQSIDLRYRPESGSITDSEDNHEAVLLDGSRKLRGRINVDGTYWVISDLPNAASETDTTTESDTVEGTSKSEQQHRQITVTIEKIIATPKDDFDIIDYDWKGIYHSEDDNEVSVRTYDAPEPFNVRQYAAEMGVDIDNLNMSMVDKTMFTSKLNITKSTLQTLHKAGYISPQEITQQKDGTEYIINPETGEPELVNQMNDNDNEIMTPKVKIPFIDTDASLDPDPLQEIETPPKIDHQIPTSVTSENSPLNTDEVVQLKRNFTRAAFIEDQRNPDNSNTNPFRAASDVAKIKKNDDDPIDALTVARLKEVLKSQGLKTSGTKSELQQRLRQQVNALLQQSQGE